MRDRTAVFIACHAPLLCFLNGAGACHSALTSHERSQQWRAVRLGAHWFNRPLNPHQRARRPTGLVSTPLSSTTPPNSQENHTEFKLSKRRRIHPQSVESTNSRLTPRVLTGVLVCREYNSLSDACVNLWPRLTNDDVYSPRRHPCEHLSFEFLTTDPAGYTVAFSVVLV